MIQEYLNKKDNNDKTRYIKTIFIHVQVNYFAEKLNQLIMLKIIG